MVILPLALRLRAASDAMVTEVPSGFAVPTSSEAGMSSPQVISLNAVPFPFPFPFPFPLDLADIATLCAEISFSSSVWSAALSLLKPSTSKLEVIVFVPLRMRLKDWGTVSSGDSKKRRTTIRINKRN